jgi:hypothetical protein
MKETNEKNKADNKAIKETLKEMKIVNNKNKEETKVSNDDI